MLDGRSPSAVRERARALGIKPAINSISLSAFVRKSGRARTSIVNAAERLGIVFRHAPRIDPRQSEETNKFIVTPEQQDAILQFLGNIPQDVRVYGTSKAKTPRGVWGVGNKPARCHGGCRRPDRPHFSRGFCKPCYVRVIKSGKPPWANTAVSTKKTSR